MKTASGICGAVTKISNVYVINVPEVKKKECGIEKYSKK